MSQDKLLYNVRIKSARYVEDYTIRFRFTDGTVQLIDFKNWILRNFGGSKKYLDKRLFKQFSLGKYRKDITWNDEMDFPFGFLYDGGLNFSVDYEKKIKEFIKRAKRLKIKVNI